MANIVLIADDLTGAADSAAPFASHGLSTRLFLAETASRPASVQVAALSTRSRESSIADARDIASRACHWIDNNHPPSPIVFKKIDSTLRGHVTEELAVVIEHFGIERLLVTPAFPSQGRTTLQGRHHVHGIPLNRSTFASEVGSDNLIERFDGVAGLPAHHLPIELLRGSQPLEPLFDKPGLYIPDIQSDADMLRFVKAGRSAGITCFCGAAGLSRALAQSIGETADHSIARKMFIGPVLVVAGSLNQATLDQVKTARQADVPVLSLETSRQVTADALRDYLNAGMSVVLTSQTAPGETLSGKEVRQMLADLVSHAVQTTSLRTLLLTGGDIAAGVCSELGATDITLHGELEPGMPVGSLESNLISGVTIMTKAGGFGDRKTFVRSLDLARSNITGISNP